MSLPILMGGVYSIDPFHASVTLINEVSSAKTT